MQCFSPCFAPEARRELIASDKNVSVGYHATDSTAGRWREPEVHVHLHSNTSSTLAAGSQKAAIKAALNAGSSSTTSSSTSQQAAAGTPCPALSTDGPAREQLRQEFLMQHGRNIMAVSTLQQEGLKYFVIPDIGYIAYALMFNGPEFLNKRTAVGLSDPVCDPQHYHTIAAAFLQQHPEAMFAQVSSEFAAVLEGFGFTVNSMGGETRLDLATYNFTGYARRGLRSAIASATKEGITVQEVMQPPPGSLGEQQQGHGQGQHSDAAAAADVGYGAGADWARIAQEMRVVDAKWAASKGGRASDFWFINRRPIFAPEAGVRKFIARDSSGTMQGYIFFDGVFEGGRLVGYYANVTRMLPDAHPGTLNLMMKTFIETARAEASLAAPARKLSIRRSQRKKQAAAAAAAAAAGSNSTTSTTTAADTTTKDQCQAPTAAAGVGSAQVAAPRPQFLSLGLSPFFQMDSSGFRSCPTTHKALQRAFDQGEGFYPFKTLAAAKAKYGAGLHDGKYEDTAVEYRHTYLCHRRGKAALVAVFDMAKLFGLWKHPADALTRFLHHKIKTRLAKRRSSSSSGGCDGSSSINSRVTSRSSSSMDGSTLSSGGSGMLTDQLSSKRSKGGAAAAGKASAVAAAGAGLTATLQKQKGAAGRAGVAAADGTGSGEVSLATSSRLSLIGTVPAPPSVDSSNRMASSEGGSDAGELAAAYTGISSAACSEITACTEGASPTWSS